MIFPTNLILITIPATILCGLLILWHFKENQKIKNQEEIIENLEQLRVLLGDENLEFRKNIIKKQMENLIKTID